MSVNEVSEIGSAPRSARGSLKVWLPLTAWAIVLQSVAQAAGAEAAGAGTASSTNAAALPAQASAGLLNDWLRTQSAAMSAWDLGGRFRLRYMDTEGAVRAAHTITDALPPGSKPLTSPVNPNTDFLRGKPNSTDELSTRVALHAGYAPASWATVYAEYFSSTQEWDQRHPSPDSDDNALQQAYLMLGDPTRFPLVAQIGRQEMAYGDQRFIGNSDWTGAGRTFDALRLRWIQDSFRVDAFTSHVVVPYDHHFNPPNQDDWFSGVYASSQTWVPWQDTHLFFLARDASAHAVSAAANDVPGTPSSARDILTFGTLWKSLPGKLGGWDYSLETAGQLGTYYSSTLKKRLSQEAFGVFASGGYTWREAWGRPRAGLGCDYGSGDHNQSDGVNGTFDNLFGTNHGLYGLMDLFGARNTFMPHAFASIKPVEKLTLAFDSRWIWMADTHDYLWPLSGSARNLAPYGIHPGFNSFVGSEVDLVAHYDLASWLKFEGGYGHFFTADYIRQTAGSIGAVNADFVYVQTTFRF